MINVLIVDDHELLRAGLRSRLEREDGISVVGEADSAERAVIVARAVQPDLILLDLLLPRMNGYDVIRSSRTSRRRPRSWSCRRRPRRARCAGRCPPARRATFRSAHPTVSSWLRSAS